MKLEIRGVSFHYKSFPVLDDVNLTVNGGDVLTLAGPNGSGKTTLLRCVSRILTPRRGAMLVDERDLASAGWRELPRYLGYVPQSAPAAFPMTVFDTVLLGRKPYINWKLGELDKTVACDALRALRLEPLAARVFSELSGGEKQKVLIARAICQEPRALLLDEPTSNLDLRHQVEVMELVRELATTRRLAVIMAMHDLNLSARFSTAIAMLKGGRIVAAGSPRAVLREEVIRDVYEVEAAVSHVAGHPFIMPLGIYDRNLP